MKKFLRNLSVKAKKESWLLSPVNLKANIENIVYFLIVLLIPTQFGRHFWPPFSYVSGIRSDYLSPTIYTTDILIVVLFIFFVSGLLKERKKKIFDAKNFLFPIVILVLLSFGILISKNQLAGWYGLLKILEFSFFAIYTAKNIRNWTQVRVLFLTFLPGIIFESSLAILQYLNQRSLGSVFYFFGERTFNSQTPGIANASLDGNLFLRPYATFSHPNVLAGYLVLSLTLIIFIFNRFSSKIFKVFLFTIILLGTSALFLTLGRASVVLWVLVLLIYFLSKSKGFGKSFAGPIYLALAIIAFIAAFFSPIYLRFAQINFYDPAFLERLRLAKSSLGMVFDHPLLGVGINNFLNNLSSYQKPLGDILFLQPVHNIFLLVLSETGIIVASVFIWFIYKTYKKIMAEKRLKLLLFFLFSEILVLGMADHYFLTLQQGQLLFSLILGLCWAKISFSKTATI